MATGSNLINTSATGQPANNEDRPFSFAIGTQIFLNPNDDPTDAVVSFKVDANLLAGTLAVGQSNLSIGLATDAELNTLSQWGQSNINQASANRFPIGFGRLTTAPSKIGVNVQAAQVATIGKPSAVSSVDTASNELSITAHPFNTGDRVVITSTGTVPGGLATNVGYFVISASANSIKLASTRANAVANTDIDIQSAGSGTITVASDEIFTLTRTGSSGSVTLKKADVTIATFSNTNAASPLRLFYWNREQSASSTIPVLKEIKVTGAI
jgi:hypothetical protein|tara:strand:+ start:2050 stop:2859 length:810 start_codon:yes stop_codon:yes gene_type:complete